MIQKSKVRAYIRERGFRLSADVLPALKDAVQTISQGPSSTPVRIRPSTAGRS